MAEKATQFSLGPNTRADMARHLSPEKMALIRSGKPFTLGSTARARLASRGFQIPPAKLLQVVRKAQLRRR